jgi:hypothetical protein
VYIKTDSTIGFEPLCSFIQVTKGERNAQTLFFAHRSLSITPPHVFNVTNRKLSLGAGLIALIVCLSLTACDEDTTDPPHTHQWGNWETTAAPTLITEATETRTCPGCKETETRTVVLPVTSVADWYVALAQLVGKTGSYTVTVNCNMGLAGSTADTFGATASGSLSVTLKGSGVLYLTSQGDMFRIGAHQTLVIDSGNLTLVGLTNGKYGATQDNDRTIILVYGGTLELKNGTITGNTTSGSGGGVFIENGTFAMSGGEIFGNTSSTNGGGVYIQGGTFTMLNGEISGNTDSIGGGVYVYNAVTAFFRIVTGTIYGSNEANTALQNTAAYNGKALFKGTLGTAQYGTFSGSTWNGTDLPLTADGSYGYYYTDNTIKVVNGTLQ